MGVIRRGLVNTAPAVIYVTLDPAAVTAAVEPVVAAAVQPHIEDLANPHSTTSTQVGAVPAIRALAVVARHTGVGRAFRADAWHWHPVTLGRILGLASLRG